MKVVALVPIKLNSQRLPHKNILPIGGHPLCWHITNTLCEVEQIDEVFVYCSDEEVKKYISPRASFLKRDARLDGDTVKGAEIYRSFIDTIDADIYVLAHTTSPFVSRNSIQNALAHVICGENDSAFSAERIQTFAWYKNSPLNYDLEDVPRTQDIEPVWIETSAFYIFKKEIFTVHKRRIGFTPYVQETIGLENIDIDEKKDYDMAKMMTEGIIS